MLPLGLLLERVTQVALIYLISSPPPSPESATVSGQKVNILFLLNLNVAGDKTASSDVTGIWRNRYNRSLALNYHINRSIVLVTQCLYTCQYITYSAYRHIYPMEHCLIRQCGMYMLINNRTSAYKRMRMYTYTKPHSGCNRILNV